MGVGEYFNGLLGIKFANAVQDTLERVAMNPAGISRLTLPARFSKVVGFPYLIIFDLQPDGFRIIAVAHSKRRFGYWQRRVDNE